MHVYGEKLYLSSLFSLYTTRSKKSGALFPRESFSMHAVILTQVLALSGLPCALGIVFPAAEAYRPAYGQPLARRTARVSENLLDERQRLPRGAAWADLPVKKIPVLRVRGLDPTTSDKTRGKILRRSTLPYRLSATLNRRGNACPGGICGKKDQADTPQHIEGSQHQGDRANHETQQSLETQYLDAGPGSSSRSHSSPDDSGHGQTPRDSSQRGMNVQEGTVNHANRPQYQDRGTSPDPPQHVSEDKAVSVHQQPSQEVEKIAYHSPATREGGETQTDQRTSHEGERTIMHHQKSEGNERAQGQQRLSNEQTLSTEHQQGVGAGTNRLTHKGTGAEHSFEAGGSNDVLTWKPQLNKPHDQANAMERGDSRRSGDAQRPSSSRRLTAQESRRGSTGPLNAAGILSSQGSRRSGEPNGQGNSRHHTPQASRKESAGPLEGVASHRSGERQDSGSGHRATQQHASTHDNPDEHSPRLTADRLQSLGVVSHKYGAGSHFVAPGSTVFNELNREVVKQSKKENLPAQKSEAEFQKEVEEAIRRSEQEHAGPHSHNIHFRGV